MTEKKKQSPSLRSMLRPLRHAAWKIGISGPRYEVLEREAPRVSLGFLTCRRLDFIRECLDAIRSHLRDREPDISYEMVLVDNGTGPDIYPLIDQYEWTKVVLHRENQGIARGLNALFGLCEGEFILSLEDDWKVINDRPCIAAAMEVMKADPKVCTVRMRETNDRPYRRYGKWRVLPSGTRYRHLNLDWESGFNVYASGGSFLRRKALLRAGPIPEVCSPMVENAYGWALGRWYVGAQLDGELRLLEHLGGKKKSPGWGDGR